MITNLLNWRQGRTFGTGWSCAEFPQGKDSLLVSNGQVSFMVNQDSPGVAAKGVMRCEVAGENMARFGQRSLHVEFCIPAPWSQDSCLFAFSAVPDVGEEMNIRSSPLSVNFKAGKLRIQKRNDPLGRLVMPPENPWEQTLCAPKDLTTGIGVWHSLDMSWNFSWKDDGNIHASLDGETLVCDNGPNCYNDARAPFPGMGLYAWVSKGDPMALIVRSWDLT